MYSNPELVLRCVQCKKPFDKQSTLKRHGYYCRSKTSGNSIHSKSRSCLCCVKRKARCDNAQPSCSRCLKKGIECCYPASSTTAKIVEVFRSDVSTEKQSELTPLVAEVFTAGSLLAADSNEENPRNDNLMLEPERNDFGSALFEWSDPAFDFSDLLDMQIDEPFLIDTTTNPSLPPSGQPPIFSALSIPPKPSSTIRSLTSRRETGNGAPRIASLILQTLKSYPMMLQHDSLPPFIHPYSISSRAEDDTEALDNCVNLVQMINRDGRGVRKLFWRNVRMECERWCVEYATWNRWKLLTAMQALSIYVFIRLGEGETEHNNLDSLMIKTVILMSKHFSSAEFISVIHSEPPDQSLSKIWSDWVYQESSQRLCVVYRVLNMLVYFEPSSLCDLQPDLLMAPLPAQKCLWEARDEYTWQRELEKSDVLTDFGLAASGDLVKLAKGQTYCGDEMLLYEALDEDSTARKSAHWEEWCSGMDGLGGLIMLAAALND